MGTADLYQLWVHRVTYIPFKPSHSDATGGPGACQAHKVTTANVAGKQRCTNLKKRETQQVNQSQIEIN